MKLGIVGLPNVGKSTLFNSLTKAGAESANYPFCTIDPNVGVVAVPDERLKLLGDLYHSKKVTPAVIEFVDIAGLVKGASKGEGLGNQFLSNIREVDAIVHVVRCFKDDNIIHVDGSIGAARDIETINLELIFADMDTVQRRKDKAMKNFRQKFCFCGIRRKIFYSARLASSFLPAPVIGFLASGGVGYGIFVCVACLFSCVAYYPFVKIMDGQQLKIESGEVEAQ